MCNLYTVRKTAAEVAEYFRVPNPIASNAGPEVYPGTPGTVIVENDGVRDMRSMTWGFHCGLGK
jgi:putative SOS response-associated peptidase YedK